MSELRDAGKQPSLAASADLGHIITGDNPGREDDEQRIVFIASGMAVFDLAWGYDLYQNALDQGIGTKLLLWDTPCQV